LKPRGWASPDETASNKNAATERKLHGVTFIIDLPVVTRGSRIQLERRSQFVQCLLPAKPIEQIRRLALDRNSRTSVALLTILLRDRYGISPERFVCAPDLEGMLQEADAALVIGDPALRVDGRYRTLDLAAEWRELTGLPFVFAVWAVREGVEMDGLKDYFHRSLRLGLEEMDLLIRQASEELALSSSEVAEYLTRNLRFHLGEEELEGLEEFYRRAHHHGLVPRCEPLRFLGGAPRRGSDPGDIAQPSDLS